MPDKTRLEDASIVWQRDVFDFSDPQRHADELLETKTGFRLALEAAKIGLWRWNLLTNILHWSDEAFSMLGYTPGTFELDFNRFRALMHPDDAPAALAQIDRAQRDDTRIKAQFRLKNSEGHWVWIECRGRVVSYDDQRRPSLIMGTYANISSVVEARQALEQAKADAEKANQDKSVFMAHLSHEVRTSLAGIAGLSQLGLEDHDPALMHDRLRKVNQSARHLLELLNDVLDFSKIEAQRLTLELRRFALSEIISSVSNLFQPLAQEKGLEFSVHVHGLGSNLYEGDDLRLRQVLQNLLGNALKFTSHGSVTLDVVNEKTAGQLDWLRFSVQDTGIGITEAQRGRLFKAFSQADNSIGRKYGGTGLGLIISQRLVHAMGGTGIELESQPGLGTTFSFLLPLTRAVPGPQALNSTDSTHESEGQDTLNGVPRSFLQDDSPVSASDFLNVDEGLRRLMGDKALYRKLLGQFQQQLAGPYAQMAITLKQLNEQSTPGDFALAQSLVHSLKGLAGNLAQHRLAEVAATLDAVLKKCQRPTPELVARYEYLCEQYGVQIAHYLAEDNAPSLWEAPLQESVDLNLVRKRLVRVSAAISANQFIPDDELAEIAKVLPLTVRQQYWRPVEQALDALDFDTASQAMVSLRYALEEH